MYKADSKIAEEFIDHQEILETLEYARSNKSNRAPVSYTHLHIIQQLQAQSYWQTIFLTKLLYECIHIATRLITTKVKNHLRTH